MRKAILAALIVAFTTHYAHAQTKIFKEINDQVSSKMLTIKQDNSLVGYMVFTKLERTSADSFNYKITIMDENLNDIGTVNFKDKDMRLQDVSFEQDVLCVSYLKSDLSNRTDVTRKEFKEAKANNGSEIFLQYISLEGKILNTNSFPVSLSFTKEMQNVFSSKVTAFGSLEHSAQLKNISQKGFACFYGDENGNFLIVLNLKGKVLWKKKIDKQAFSYSMHTFGPDIFFLTEKEFLTPGGYTLLGYSLTDTTAELNYPLVDKSGSELEELKFENDPATNKPYIAGLILNSKKDAHIGLCTININGVDNKAVNVTYTYWDKNPLDSTTNTREFEKQIKDTKINYAFKDFDGLTYFAASNHFNGAELIKQNSKGTISIETNILDESPKAYKSIPNDAKFGGIFYRLLNTETKADYLVADANTTITIYDVTNKKVVRSIPRTDAGITTSVSPAKEGYIMVTEYNKKEKYTKLSIEAL